ncbi:MAG: AAA family ATPase [Candidatus Binatia bacterium]
MPATRPTDPSPIRIEADDERAWCGDRCLDLPPKTFAVLRHLVAHAGRLVTKSDLLDAVWSDTVVSEASLSSCIRDLRRALDDSSREPRYIETVHRRGFRFIGPVAAAAGAAVAALAPDPGRDDPVATRALVGRTRELAALDAALASALGGRRQLVFVTGEAGIGKTTLVEAFLAGAARRSSLRILRGQCVEQYGAGEPWLPLLDALGRLARESDGARVVRVLRQFAPTWLAQLPALLGDAELEALRSRTHGTTRERMLRELADALDALAAETPVVVVLEDLHWSDSATVDLLAMVARRRDTARLLILGTLRPADVAASGHPLRAVKQELETHGLCAEVAPDLLDDDTIDAYLAARFRNAALPDGLAAMLRESSGGNPLFLVNVVDDLVEQGQLREQGDGAWSLAVPIHEVRAAVPDTLAQILDKQIARLADEERAVLAVCAVAGAEFSAAVTIADGIEAGAGERACDALARRGQFLRAAGAAEWPDGTVAARFAFVHAAYRNALYERVPIGRRVAVHLRIGALLERAHGVRAAEIAGELAMHFAHGRDFERAAHWHRLAAEAALRRHAYREASRHADEALSALASSPASPARDEQELALETVRGAAVIATDGWGAPGVAEAYGRARELCADMGPTRRLHPVLLGLCGFYLMRGDLDTADGVTRQLLEVAHATGDAAVRLGAHNMAGLGAFYRGDLAAALEHFTRAAAAASERGPQRGARELGVDHDPAASCAAHTAWTLSALDRGEEAAATMRDCIASARATRDPVSLVMALNFAAAFHQDRRENALLAEVAEEQVALATEHGLPLFTYLGEIHLGWLDCEEGRAEQGIERIRRGVDVHRLAGASLGAPTFLAILADACGRAGRIEEGLAALDEAMQLAERTGLHYWDAELHRVRGTLLLRAADAASGVRAEQRRMRREADACFAEAIAIAQRQGATLFERRAARQLAAAPRVSAD